MERLVWNGKHGLIMNSINCKYWYIPLWRRTQSRTLVESQKQELRCSSEAHSHKIDDRGEEGNC